jgi:hypothetical protein
MPAADIDLMLACATVSLLAEAAISAVLSDLTGGALMVTTSEIVSIVSNGNIIRVLWIFVEGLA